MITTTRWFGSSIGKAHRPRVRCQSSRFRSAIRIRQSLKDGAELFPMAPWRLARRRHEPPHAHEPVSPIQNVSDLLPERDMHSDVTMAIGGSSGGCTHAAVDDFSPLQNVWDLLK